MNVESDREIVEAVLAGARSRFEVLVERYYRPLLHVGISQLKRTEWAEDAVQETFVAAFRSLHTYQAAYNFRTWLWTIMLNQCRRHLRQMAKTSRDVEFQDENQTVPDDKSVLPDARLLANERHRQLEQLLATLPADQANAIRLRFLGELKFREIAEAMNCSLAAAKQRVRHGLKSLSTQVQSTTASTSSSKPFDPTSPPHFYRPES